MNIQRHLNHLLLSVLFCLFSFSLIGCSAKANNYSNEPTQVPYKIRNITYYPIPSSAGYREKGIASWYGRDFHGRLTSNGERYNMHDMTAAHKTLPMNTMLLVKNLENGKEVIVRVNDRGPFVRGRIIDLSYKAAQKLQMVRKGISRVQVIAMADEKILLASAHGQATLPNLQQGEFYIQIGSFARQKNAINLQKKFTQAGHTAVIQKYYSPKKLFYRVQVYAGKELSAARRAEKALLEHGYKGAFAVAR